MARLFVDDFFERLFGLFDVSLHHLFEGLAVPFAEDLLPFQLFGGTPEKKGPFGVDEKGDEENEKEPR